MNLEQCLALFENVLALDLIYESDVVAVTVGKKGEKSDEEWYKRDS